MTVAPGAAHDRTLLQVLTSTKGLRGRLSFLANLCHCHPRMVVSWQAASCMKDLPVSANLLSCLWSAVCQAEAGPDDLDSDREVLLALLEESAAPYLRMIAKWAYQVGTIATWIQPK